MISEKEKKQIIEQVKFENQIRKALAGEQKETPKKSRWAWLESKLGILVIGAIITGILVPLFQYTQESIKWTRQNRYDNLKYRMEMVRNAMGELTMVQAYVAEAYERSRPLLNSTSLDQKTVETYKKNIVDMHNRRFIQNAKFVGYLSYFPENERRAINDSFNNYLSAVQAYMILLDKQIATGDAGSRYIADPDEFDRSINSLIEDININYEESFEIIKRHLRRLENASERYL